MEQANNVSKYLKILSRYSTYDNIYYRGQSEKFTTIPPAIARKEEYLENEFKIYNEALTIASNDFSDLNLPIEMLAKMQHYGIPTRLVDVTIDPLIALFFAVQDIDCECAGNVYIYIPKEYLIDSKEAKALSLLAIIEDRSIYSLCRLFYKEFGEDIKPEEMTALINNPIFIKHCNQLKKSNNRLFNQKGTFVICSNQIDDNIILPDIISLDSIKPTLIIRIPYEYKVFVKNELDQKYKINETIIYPELPSVANYIKAKYDKKNISLDGTFSKIEEKEVSTVYAKRISIIIALNKNLTIEQIKTIARNVTEQYTDIYDVVWVFIAKNGDDYIMSNWLFRTQWTKHNIDLRYKPLALKHKEGNDYSYEENDSYSTLTDYYLKYVFQDDKMLLVCHKKIFDDIYPKFLELVQASKTNDITILKSLVDKHKKEFSKAFFKFNDFGHSRNAAFDEYLYLFDNAMSLLDNLHFWCENSKLSDISKCYELRRSLNDAEKQISIILDQYKYWELEFKVTPKDYKNITMASSKREEYQYIQTIPISQNAINVKFDEKIHIYQDNTFIISGNTNLYDNAVLMLSIRDTDGKLYSQGEAPVSMGFFEFPQMSLKGNGYPAGTYSANISLSLPSVQPKEFIKKAGIEYENLKGEYVNRKGIGPTVEYNFTFSIP